VSAHGPAPPFPCVVFDLDGTLTTPGTTRPVPGTADLITALDARGVLLALATSAPTRTARQVLDALGVLDHFASVAGRGPDGVDAGKDAVVAEALLGLGWADAAPGSLLVGDGPGDIAAARAHDLVPVGVAWGASPASALWVAGARAVLTVPADLWALGV
jgi:phosphoglycolate phosphatase